MTRALIGMGVLMLAASPAAAQTRITYQGRLADAGVPAAGTFDLRFILYDSAVGGSQVGAIQDRDDVVVADGLFTTTLDFGPGAFANGARWLDVSVRAGASTGAYTPLVGRQELTPAPSATFASRAPWSGITGKPAGFADDDDADTLAGLACANGQVPKWGGASWVCSPDEGTTYAAGSGLQLVSNVFSLAVDGVASVHLGNAAVVEAKLAASAVTTPKIANGAVDASKLADLAVTTNKIQVGAVTGAQIATGTIPFGDIASNGCTLNQVVKFNGAVWSCGTDQDSTYSAGPGLNLAGSVFGIAGDGVTTPMLSSGVVTTAKLATGAVTGAQIADGSIGLADLGANGCLVGQVMKWTGTAWACVADADGGGDITAVTAGAGLTGGATTGAAALAVSFAGPGAASTVARSDHDHAATYAASVHDHVGQAWNATTSPGLQVTSSGAVGFSGRSQSGSGTGVLGEGLGATGIGVLGRGRFGVSGESTSTSGSGVSGLATASTGSAIGVQATSTAPAGYGVYAVASAATGDAIGVFGRTSSPAGTGLYGSVLATTGVNYGVYGRTSSSAGYAGYFAGDVEVTGTLSRPAEEQTIDHPLDPENRYLRLAGVASPDMKNVLDGLTVTDASGHAVVELPDWFEASHRDFRYQLTILDEGDAVGFVQAKVVRKLAHGRFVVRTSAPGVEVSWQVTGIRRDPFAERHRTVVEADKRPEERGTYLHPEAWGQPSERGLAARHIDRKED